MSLVEAALLDQERRLLEMDRTAFRKLYCDHGSWGKMPLARAWCKKCGGGIGQTRPNLSGYCARRDCQNEKRLAEARAA